MTEKDFELQELRRRLQFLEKENEKLTHIHQLDMAEVVNMRRQVEAMEAMSPTTRETVKRIGWMELCSSENPETIRAQFRQIYETVSKRAAEDRKIPPQLQETISQLQLGFEKQKQIGGVT